MVDNYRKRQAILCGVSNYSRIMGNPLPTVEQEISVIADTLSNKLHEGYRYKVTSYLNENVTLNDLPTIFAPYKQDSPTDELLFYFSGHGTIYNDEPYFVTYGAASNSPGIKLSDLATEVSSLHPGIKQIFLILDFCHSGGILKAISLSGSEKVAVLTATRQFQVAEVTTQDGKSFAQHFIDGTTNAPANNGEISFGQLAHYIKEQMKTSYVQSPSFFSIGDVAINKINTKFFVPYKRNPFFTGREEILAQIHTRLSSNSNVSISQPPAISGLGGIGKTQTALEFCHRHLNDYQTILWVNAENQISFNNSYYNIAPLLDLPLKNLNNEALKPEEVVTSVKNKLATIHNWLMVLDNLEDPKLINNYLPPNHQGHVLITTRSQSLKGYASIVQLKKMSPETGTLFLLKRANLIPIASNDLEQLKLDNKVDGVLIDDAQKIVQAMDGLPLALEQAGAYIQESACSLANYLKAYQDVRNTASILDNDGEDANDHKSVYATFNLNFDAVKQKSLAAAKLLEVCSFLDSELIPEEIFTSAGNFLGDELTKLQDNTYEFNNCLKLLLNYSLIERDTNNKFLSIHRLVQTVIRELISEDNKKSLIDSLAKALYSLSNDDAEDPKNWPTYQKLLASVTSFFDFAKLYQSNAVEVAYLFHQFGLYCDKQALFTQSLTFYNHSLDIKKHLFGNNHPSVAGTLNNIATIYDSQSNYPLALDLYNQALSICKHHFGDNHPSVAGTLNNIGAVYKEQASYSLALDFYNQALTIYKHLFGNNHPSVATTLNNIGAVYKEQASYSLALDFYNQALSIKKHLFGYNHPSVALTLNNIGEVYRQQTNYSQALDFYNQSLVINKHYFGDNHPFVAGTLNNIAIIYKEQGDYPQALDFYNQALTIRKYYFGDNHPDVAGTLNNIGEVYKAQGNYPLALQYYNQSLDIKKHHFGDNHPSVASTLNNIGAVYGSQHNYSQALSFYNQALNIRKHHFGNNHIDVAITLVNIAHVYENTNKELEATNYYQQALQIFDKSLPPTYPLIAQLLKQYSQLLLKLKKNSEAQPLLNRLNALGKPTQQLNQRPSINNSTFNISFASPLKPKT